MWLVLKLGHFGKRIRNSWEVLKCGIADGWRRRFGPIARKMMYCTAWGEKGISFIWQNEGRLTELVGHIWRRTCFLKQFVEQKVEGRMEVAGRRRKTCRQLLDDLKVKRWHCKLKEEALVRTLCRTHFGRGCGPVVGQTIKWKSCWQGTQSGPINYLIRHLAFVGRQYVNFFTSPLWRLEFWDGSYIFGKFMESSSPLFWCQIFFHDGGPNQIWGPPRLSSRPLNWRLNFLVFFVPKLRINKSCVFNFR
jgi:hypothetical protein